MPPQQRLGRDHQRCPTVSRKRSGRNGEKRPVHRAKPRTADLSAKHLQLVAEHQDLDVLGAVIRRACDKASHRAGDQGEEEQHPRMLRIGELEGESEFPTPTGFGTTVLDVLPT